MARNLFEKVSQTEYAKRLGVSKEAVSKAVRQKRIREGWDAKNKVIIVDKANREWGFLHINTDIGAIMNSNDDVPKPPKAESSMMLRPDTSFAEARRINEIIRGQLQAVELKKVKGELVNKQEVYKQLFNLGQQMKVNVMGLPDKVIDNLLASKSRAEAHQLLTAELHDTLEGIIKEFSKS